MYAAPNQVVVLTDSPLNEQLKVGAWTHTAAKKLVVADTFGLFGVIFNDFGAQHVVDDATGEDAAEVYVEYIDRVSNRKTEFL